MIAQLGGRGAAPAKSLYWWLSLGPSLLWRVPLLLVLSLLMLWFAFRGLVHLAFLFEAHPKGTFLFAPALMPFAGAPALCFYACIRLIPSAWHSRAWTPGRRHLIVAFAPLAALIVAQVIDLVQINGILLMGIPLPRLPFDPY